MRTLPHAHWRLIHCMTASAIVLSMVLPHVAYAQQPQQPQFELRPHCENGNEVSNVFGGPSPNTDQMTAVVDGRCPTFEIRDPQSRQTPVLTVGNSLDMDLVLHNPNRDRIKRFRAWIAYDPSTMIGEEVTVSPLFPTPTPGEVNFSEADGFIKISGTSDDGQRDEEIVVARIRMRVKEIRTPVTPLTFATVSADAESKTGIFTENNGAETNISTPTLGFLYVRLNNQSSSAARSVISSAVTGNSMSTVSSAFSFASSSAPVAPSALFTMLQVQGLRLTTEGGSVFLAWDALPSSELVGYNLYYGTTSGRYIQRRSLDSSATSVTIRALPVGTTYYFAIRGVNAQGQETEFSQEVGISVGNPKTSTSPLLPGTRPTPTPGTDGDIAGETGSSSILVLFLVLSAVTGTVFAFRRQLAVKSI